MHAIYKYPLAHISAQTIPLPVGAEILSVQIQIDQPCLWARVNLDEQDVQVREIFIVDTGLSFPSDLKLKFIDTFQLMGGTLIFHVFEVLEAD